MKLETFTHRLGLLLEHEIAAAESDSEWHGWEVAPFGDEPVPHSFIVDDADGTLQFVITVVAP